MSFPRAVSAALVLVLSIGILGASAQAQTAPPTLVAAVGDLYPAPDNKLKNGTAPQTALCGTAFQPNATPSATGTWTLEPMPFNGTGAMYHIAKQIAWEVTVFGTSATGFNVQTSLGGATSPVTSTGTNSAPVTNNAIKITGNFAINETNFQSHDGKALQWTVTVRPNAAGAVATSPQGQIQCGSGTKLTSVELIRGMPGNGDLDADGIPDPEDPDKDGDGAPNLAERAAFTTPQTAKGPVKCQELVPLAEDDPRIKPGDSDSDGDGITDQDECAAGYSPLSAQSVPPRPRTLMDILLPIIIILVILGVLAALVFAFLRFGKIVQVTVLTSPEVIIPAGTKSKYELGVQNLAKKGEPLTLQLVVTGIPEGWDAKLNVDHVTLDPQGGANNQARVWLEVEAPVHQEPESAVVTVKAVPLNKAGRKDALKLPGRASTITSINLPPGSKVPVKRGGKVAPAKTEEEVPATPAGPAAEALPVASIASVGDANAAKLEKANIRTVGDLRTADAALIAKKTGAPLPTVAAWKQAADLTQVEGVSPQLADQLVRSGITTIAQLAEQKPKELAAQVQKTDASAAFTDKQAKHVVKDAQRWTKANAAPAAPAAAAAATAAPAAAPAPTAPAAAKPQLQVGGLKHDPPAFRQGESVKSIVSVSNNGKDKSTIKLSLYVNDGLADVQTVTVKPGKAQDVQFKWTAQERNKLNIRGELVSQ